MIGIVVVNYNTWEISIECVNSIEKTCTLPYHIYIVDNCSVNDSFEKLKMKLDNNPNVTVVLLQKNGGYGYGLNCGGKIAINDGCDAVIASNNDIIYLNNSIEQMYKVLEEDETIGIVCVQQLTILGDNMVSAIKNSDTAWSIALMFFPLCRIIFAKQFIAQKKLLRENTLQKVFCPNGGCYMFRSKVLEDIGYYDENIFLYAEENIIGKKIEAKKYNVVLCPKARVIHSHRQTTGNDISLMQLRMASSILYYGKEYLKWNILQENSFKIWFYINATVKAMIRPNYRRRWKELINVFNK